LVQQARTGSSDALGELYEAFADDIFSVAHRIVRSRPDAEDVMQDMFAGLTKALGSYEHSSGYAFSRWLSKVALRLAVARANALERGREIPVDSLPAVASTVDRSIDRLALEQAIATLTPGVRAVFLLSVVDGYSHQEISALLGIRIGASRGRLHRARKELRSILGDLPVARRSPIGGSSA
jgi:RNA polymerase sigma-70 factor (ECF subfamily)